MTETLKQLRREVEELIEKKYELQTKFNALYKEHLSELSAQMAECTVRIKKLNEAIDSLTNLCHHEYREDYKDRESLLTCTICGYTYWEY